MRHEITCGCLQSLFKLPAVGKNTLIQRQTERLRRGEINRRRFIMSAMATGVTLPTATSLAQRVEAAQPKAGGSVRIGVADAGRHQDIVALATGSTLLEVDLNGRLIGDLAHSFDSSNSGQRWVIELRDTIRFHDGARLDAPAVVAALSGIDTPGLRGQIQTLRADGARNVIFDLLRPNPDFAWALTDAALTVRNRSGAGTGAFVMTPQNRLERHPEHWKLGRGHFDTIDVIPLPDPKARLAALLNGDVDLVDDVDPATVALLARTPEINLLDTKAASLYGFARQSGADQGIGRALLDTQDRRDLADRVLLGHGQARGCADCLSDAPKTVQLAPPDRDFPGGRDMLTMVTKLAEKRGHTVSLEQADLPHLKAERIRLRPTIDWTLAEIVAKKPDAKLEKLIEMARATRSPEEKTGLQEQAWTHLERQGHLYPLIADDIHAHRTTLEFPTGQFDLLRVAERGWLAH